MDAGPDTYRNSGSHRHAVAHCDAQAQAKTYANPDIGSAP
jgi:hypothetical protein